MGEGIGMNFSSSMEVAKIATQTAISTREEEEKLKEKYKRLGTLVTAVNIGGNINESTTKILERTIVAAKRSGTVFNLYSIPCHP